MEGSSPSFRAMHTYLRDGITFPIRSGLPEAFQVLVLPDASCVKHLTVQCDDCPGPPYKYRHDMTDCQCTLPHHSTVAPTLHFPHDTSYV